MSQKEDGTNGNPAYISQVLANKADLEARVEDYKVKNPTVDISNSFEYFMLNRVNNFLNLEMKDFVYKGFLRGTSIWRDPIFLNKNMAKELYDQGFYTTVPLKGV